jgi:hypothetical protein
VIAPLFHVGIATIRLGCRSANWYVKQFRGSATSSGCLRAQQLMLNTIKQQVFYNEMRLRCQRLAKRLQTESKLVSVYRFI